MLQTTSPTPDEPGRWVISKFGPPSVLEWKTFNPLPSPSEVELLIWIVVTGISGADNMQRVRGYRIDERCQQPGFTPGYDFVGYVEAVGPSTSPDFDVGDLVTCLATVGGYGTHVIKLAVEVVKLRSTDDAVQVCALPLNYMTAYGMLKRSGVTLERGSSVLISSVSGGVGTAVAQLARTFDMGLNLYGTCSPSKFEFVKSLGVTPIDRRIGNLAQRVRELTGGKGLDVAYDAAASKDSLDASAAATKDGTGQVVVVGVMSAVAPDGSGILQNDFYTFEYINRWARMSFWAVILHYYIPSKDICLKDFEEVLQAVRDGKLELIVGKIFRLSEAVQVNEMLTSATGVMGKMEFIVDSELAIARGL